MGARIIVVVAAAVLVLLTACESTSGTSENQLTTSAATVATVPPATAPSSPATPKYSIILPAVRRKDGNPNYFVVIAPVDLSNDSFKQDVKLVVQSIANTTTNTTISGPDFSARIFDDEAVAKAYLEEETDPSSSSGRTRDEMRAYLDERGQHLVATYQGGLKEFGGWPYHISWYPGAFPDTPNVGPYVGSEQWKPEV